jgi:hypothetical protein
MLDPAARRSDRVRRRKQRPPASGSSSCSLPPWTTTSSRDAGPGVIATRNAKAGADRMRYRMCLKDDPLPDVCGGRLVVAGSGQLGQRHEEDRLVVRVVVVHEPVPGVGIHFDVVRDLEHREDALEPHRRPPSEGRSVPAPVAAHDRAGAGKYSLGILRASTVVDAACGEPAIGCERQRVAAAHAEADDPDLSGCSPPGRRATCVRRRCRRTSCLAGR